MVSHTRYDSCMKVMTARVVDGRIDTGVELTQAHQKELEEALAEIERGEYVDGRELLRELKGLATR